MNRAYTDSYRQYLQKNCLDLPSELASQICEQLDHTHWDAPQSAQDALHCGVLALVEAERCEGAMREMYVELAIQALDQAAEHPLAGAHQAVILRVLGETDQATEVAFTAWMTLLESAHTTAGMAAGLVYLPSCWGNSIAAYSQLQEILEAEDANQQALRMLAEVLQRSQLAFYSETGLRFLQLATQVLSGSVLLNLRLGVACLVNDFAEGLLYFYRANQQQPDSPVLLHGISLAYRGIGNMDLAEYWRRRASERAPHPLPIAWRWTDLSINAPFTYLPFESDLVMAVEPHFGSIVTSVLLAEADWFEAEMEFWRDVLRPGMTVIDVGANVGVYTFSAARRVGATGRVLAIEPFPSCICCLEATVSLNDLTWVQICPGAASDRNGTAYLKQGTTSELNALVPDEMIDVNAESSAVQAVNCFTLDRLMLDQALDRVDFVKIDAEGHELAVLSGSTKLLERFQPIIMYENQSVQQDANLPVMEFFQERGYRLHYYQPYLKRLMPIESIARLNRQLNVIAVPPS